MRAVAILLVLCAVWGVQQVASKAALDEGLPPITQALLRSIIAGIVCWCWEPPRVGG